MANHFNFMAITKSLLVLACLLSCFQVSGQSKKNMDSLLLAYKNFKSDTSQVLTLIEIAYQYKTTTPDTMLLLSRKALEKAQKLGFERGQAWALNRMGVAYHAQGKYEEVVTYSQKSLDIFLKIKDNQGIAQSLHNLGIVYRIQGKYPKALDCLQKSLKLREKMKDLEGIANSFNSMGEVYRSQNDFTKALKYYQKSLEMREKLGDVLSISNSFNNIGITYESLAAYPKALEYHLKSLKIKEKLADLKGISTSLNNIGAVYREMKEYDKALEHCQKSLEIKEKIGDKRGATYPLNGMAQIYYRQQQYEKSIFYGEKGLSIAQEIKAIAQIKLLSNTLYETYKQTGDYKKALACHEIFKATSDSLSSEEQVKQLANLEAKAEIEKHQDEIAFLHKSEQIQRIIIYLILGALLMMGGLAYLIYRAQQKEKKAKEEITEQNEEIMQQNEEIISQREALTEVNNTKDKLFAIIGHDLRAPIGSLKGVLGLVAGKHIDAEEFQEISGKLMQGVEYVYFTLNNLLTWANSQMQGISANPQSTNISELIQENIQLLGEIAKNKGIDLQNTLPTDAQVWADANQINLVFRNLISNSLKFTKSGGTISLKGELKNDVWELSVADTGIGMSPEALAKLFKKSTHFTTSGTSGEKGTGLGLLLCQEMVEKNKGHIWVESEVGKGTTFKFTLPQSM